MHSPPIALDVRNLSVYRRVTGTQIVSDLSFTLKTGEILGLVGESGSGKTTLGLALLDYCRRGLEISNEASILVAGHSIRGLDAQGMRSVRGSQICYVPQDPSSALNPALKIRTQLLECGEGGEKLSDARLKELLHEVKLPGSSLFLDSYPHQISGGQQQRVAIAMAFANRPRVIVMDEPTTGLDVTTQAHILEMLRRLCSQNGVATVYISHDLSVIASIADRVAVMYAGRIVEAGVAKEVLHRPRHPYTQALIAAVPDLDRSGFVQGIPGQVPDPGARPKGCSFAARCSRAKPACHEEVPAYSAIGTDHYIRCINPLNADQSELPTPIRSPRSGQGELLLNIENLRASHGTKEILHGASLSLETGSCLAIVGESGSGKTTLARCIAGLHSDYVGSIFFRNTKLAKASRSRLPEQRRLIQYVFQNPYASLNPRRTIGESISSSLSVFESISNAEGRSRVKSVLDSVALPAAAADRYPSQLSGGQRQRAAIARALILRPELLICDEITSALDVSVQAVIVELLNDLKRRQGLSLIFVTHNLALVGSIAEQVAVLRDGNIVEVGKTVHLLRGPKSQEARDLLRDTPRLGRVS